jgi:lipid II:glycine glycyltransferase (peptidoglycan interpeptide bridge formation enzyme)
MAGKLVLLDNERMGSWDAFVKAHQAGSVYHTSAWRSVIESAYGHEPLYFALQDDRGCIVAGLPVFLVRSRLTGTRFSTLPCAQSCNPLVGEELQYHDLKQGILEYMAAANIDMWEMKTTEAFTFEKGDTSASSDGFLTHLLRIDRPAADLFSALHKSSIQRAIGKARRSGLVLRRCDSREGVESFVRLYSQMRREKGLLPQPGRFFVALWDILNRQKMIDILYADYQGQPVSAVMLLKYKDTVVYEYGATEEGCHRLSPSPFLLWEAILQASAEGYRTFDFGRTADSEEGLIQFKDRWGTRQQRLPYYEMAHRVGMSSMRRDGRAKMIMAFAMRILPGSMCNAAGSLLYKHLV